MSLSRTLIDASVVAAVAYGAVLIAWKPSPVRTVVKASAVGCLAVIAYIVGAPLPLIAALTASAVGDAFLAGDPEQWLAGGLAAFLLADFAYVWLFLDDGFGLAMLQAEPLRAVGAMASIAVGLAMLAWLWRSVEALKPAVIAYTVAISLTAASAFTLSHRLWPAIVGAALLMASSVILAAKLFRGLRGRWPDYVIWSGYYVAQFGILWAYTR